MSPASKMPDAMANLAMPSSPPLSVKSIGESCKNEDTPNTRITDATDVTPTVKSAKLVHGRSRSDVGVSSRNIFDVSAVESEAGSTVKNSDPFTISNSVASKTPEPSANANATANAFVPLPQTAFEAKASQASLNKALVNEASADKTPLEEASVDKTLADRVPVAKTQANKSQANKTQVNKAQANNRAPQAPRPLPVAHQMPAASARLTTDIGISRVLRVVHVRQVAPINAVKVFISGLEALGRPAPSVLMIMPFEGRVYVRCTDIRDACNLFSELELRNDGWRFEFVTEALDRVANILGYPIVSAHEAQLLVSIISQTTPPSPMRIMAAEKAVREYLDQKAHVFAVRSTPSGGQNLQFLVELSDVHQAQELLQDSRGHYHQMSGVEFEITQAGPRQAFQSFALGFAPGPAGPAYTTQPQHHSTNAITRYPRATSSPSHLPPSMSQAMFGRAPTPITPTRKRVYVPTYAYPPTPYQPIPMSSPYGGHSGRAMVRYVGPGMTQRPMTVFQPNPRAQAARVHRFPGHGKHDDSVLVILGEIESGKEIRTTIMLRNIPNQVDHEHLKAIVDKTSQHKYDFLYLRIDFETDCNVGYAFINFVDPLDVIPFAKAHVGVRWNCFGSDKIAEISFANVQGKDCLITKFRNSSVMLEAPHRRPRLYYSSNGPHPDLVGQEEEFPRSNNAMKLRRSCENAATVGLFTPHAGQHHRNEQRNRRSRYDRGTPSAAVEEFEMAAVEDLQGMTIEEGNEDKAEGKGDHTVDTQEEA